MTTIEIQECYGEHAFTSSNHRGADMHQAINKAISKRYGKKALYFEDSGLREAHPRVRFGQVFKRIKGERGYTSLTGRICITVR